MSISCFWRQGSMKLSEALNKSINVYNSTLFSHCLYERKLTSNEQHNKRCCEVLMMNSDIFFEEADSSFKEFQLLRVNKSKES